MKIRILGASGGIGTHARTTAMLVDRDIRGVPGMARIKEREDKIKWPRTPKIARFHLKQIFFAPFAPLR